MNTVKPIRIVVWGTYDTGKPRVRIMLNGLERTGARIEHCHKDVWGGIEDKSGVKRWRDRIGFIFKWLFSYPVLLYRYLKLPRHDVVIVGYMGHLDVLILWPFARCRGVPIIWDAFLSLYNTVVEDRKLIGPRNPVAWLLYGWEWLACRAASLVVLDTSAHAEYFGQRFNLRRDRTADVPVGAETELFHPGSEEEAKANPDPELLSVLFYGQFIPLHGIETIIQAAARLEAEPVEWRLVGTGQEAERIRQLLERHPLPRLSWTPWVPYRELPDWIRRADLCLGIFGDTVKAAMVIPNKVFQVLAVGKPLITRDSPAVRELFSPDAPGITLVPASDPDALADAVAGFRQQRERIPDSVHRVIMKQIEPAAIGEKLVELARRVSEPAERKED